MNRVLARRRSLDPLGGISILYAKSGMMSITKLVDRSPACVGIFINDFTALIFKNTANLPARVIRGKLTKFYPKIQFYLPCHSV